MSRSRPVRRRRTSAGQFRVRPFVAFLLVASFGILFAGCSSVSGPTKEDLMDTTFTASDAARFKELAAMSASSTGSLAVSSTDSSEPILLSNTGSSSDLSGLPVPEIDLSMVAEYNALRTAPAKAGGNSYVVTNTILNVREGPTAQAKLVRVLNQGDPITVTGWENGEWAKVEIPGGAKGYVTLRYIAKDVSKEDLEKEKRAFDNMYYVSFAFVNVRKEPNQGSEKLGEIPGKQIVKPTKIENGWALLEFQGKPGYVSLEYLTAFSPKFTVRQNSYEMAVLRYNITDDASLQTLVGHMTSLKQRGVKILTFSDLRTQLIAQSKNGATIDGKIVVLGITGLTAANVRKVSDALTSNGMRATLFLETKNVGLSGITQKTLMTLLANGLDIQSAGHTGDDLRALTNAQVKLELQQSRKILEDLTGKPVYAVFYPQGGANERVAELAGLSGYLFGVGSIQQKSFTRSELLRLPSVTVTGAMTAEDLLKLLPS